MLFQKLQQIYTSQINMIYFPYFLLLTNQETLYNLNIVLSFHPSFEPITALLQLQVYLNSIYIGDNRPCLKSQRKSMI